ncbi:MAG: hypothetical protein ACRELF_09545 [Gemmataceae bacterium]
MPDVDAEYERNNAAYRRLKETISRTYPHNWFVGIADEQVVGAAADFRALESLLRTQGKDPRRVLVVQAGVDYPEYVTIFEYRD